MSRRRLRHPRPPRTAATRRDVRRRPPDRRALPRASSPCPRSTARPPRPRSRRSAASFVAPAEATELAPAAVGMRREVYGFLPYWEVADSTTRVDFSVLTHIAYFSVGADASGQPEEAQQRRLADDRLGRLDQLEDDVAHQRRPPASRSRVTLTITVVRLDRRPGERPEGAARQLDGPAQPREAGRRRRPRPRRGRDQPRLRAPRLRATRTSSSPSSGRCGPSSTGSPPGYHLSFDTLGYPGNYPLEGALAAGGADAVFVMGYDYRTASAGRRGLDRPARRPGLRPRPTRSGRYTARVPGRQGHPRRAVLRAGLVDRRRTPSTPRPRPGAKYGSSIAVNYENARRARGRARPPLRRDRGQSAWTAYRKQNCTATYGCVTTLAPALLRRRADAQGPLRPREPGRPAGHRDVGARLRRDAHRALRGPRRQVPQRHDAAAGRDRRSRPTARRDEGFAVSWTAVDDWSGIASYDVQVVHRRRRLDGLAVERRRRRAAIYLGADGDGYAFRVRARDGKGNVSPWNVTQRLRRARRRSPAGGFLRRRPPTSSTSARRPTTSASRLATAAAGDVFAITGGPVDGRRLHLVRGRPARSTTWGPVGDVFTQRLGGGRRARAPRTRRRPGAERTRSWTAGDPPRRLHRRRGRQPRDRRRPRSAARSFSPNGDGSRRPAGDPLEQPASTFDTLELRVLRPDGTPARHDRARARRRPGGRRSAWDGTRRRRDPAPTARTSSSSSGRPTGPRTTGRPPSPAATGSPPGVGVPSTPCRRRSTSAAITATKLSPNGDGTYDTVDGERHGLGGRRPLGGPRRPAGRRGGGDPSAGSRAAVGRQRPPGTGPPTTARGCPTGATGSRSASSTPPATRPRAPGRSPSTRRRRRSPVGAAPAAFSPERRRHGRHDAAHVDERGAGDRQRSIVSRGTTTLRAWSISGTSGSAAWNGRDADGRLVADGRLTVTVRRRTRLANRAGRSSARHRGPHGGLAALVADGVLPAGRRRARADLDRVRPAGPDGAGDAPDPRRVRRRGPASRGRAASSAPGRARGAGTAARRAAPGRRRAATSPSSRPTSSLGTTVLRRTVVAAAFPATPSTATPAAGSRLTGRRSGASSRSPRRPGHTSLVPGRAAVSMTVVRLADGSWRASVVVPAGAAGRATVSLRGARHGRRAQPDGPGRHGPLTGRPARGPLPAAPLHSAA